MNRLSQCKDPLAAVPGSFTDRIVRFSPCSLSLSLIVFVCATYLQVQQVCKLVDHVYVLAAGQVAQSGTHEQLLEDKESVYARLVGAQES